jgi:hypothetical protein
MAQTTAAAFDQFHDRIQPTDDQNETIESRRKAVAEFLGSYFGANSDMALLEARVIGSAARRTIIRPLDDIDVLARFDAKTAWDKYKGDSQSFLYRIRQALTKYRVETVGARGQVVRLFYDSGPHTDIAPVFGITGGGFYLPKGDGGWLKTEPEKNDEYLARRNTELGGNLKRFTRMLKQWNRAHSRLVRGFHLEVIAASSFKTLGTDSRAAFDVFFEYAPNFVHCADPAGNSGDLAARWSADREQAVKDAFVAGLQRARRAREAEARGHHEEAIRLWRVVFGDLFPPYG